MDRVFIVHHGLTDLHSHYYGEALGWREACRARGIEPRFYIGQNALPSIVQELGARPVFPFPSDAMIELDPRCQQLSDYLNLGGLFGEACRALEQDGVGGDDLVIVPFASERDVYGSALWLERLAPQARPTMAFTFMLPDFRWRVEEDRKRLVGDISYYAYAAKRILAVLPAHKLILNGIDRRLCRTIKAATQHPCTEVPLGTYFPSEAELAPRGEEQAPPHAHVGVAGEFRLEKGSKLIGEVLLRFGTLRPNRAVAVQLPDEAQAVALETYWRGRGMRAPHFLYFGWADHRVYLQRLLRTDILLLPYHWERYAIRPSGIFSEAVAYGVVPVVPARTWASDKLEAGWGAGTTFGEFSADAMLEALVAASDDFPALKERAAVMKLAWREAQSTAALLDKILAQRALLAPAAP